MTRRTAVLGGGAALLVAGCGGRPARLLAGDPRDLRILNAALATEREQIAFYEAGVRLSDAPNLKLILAQERAHEAAITEAIRELGGTPPARRPIARYRLSRGFDAWKQDAIGREEQWSAGYIALLPKLANQRLRATFGALATTEAEHAVALDLS